MQHSIWITALDMYTGEYEDLMGVVVPIDEHQRALVDRYAQVMKEKYTNKLLYGRYVVKWIHIGTCVEMENKKIRHLEDEIISVNSEYKVAGI